MDDYKKTGLWRRSLGAAPDKDDSKFIKLNAAYSSFRTKAFQLTAQISKTLPSLTIHDGTHLDALWEMADLIAGPDYPLNPMEGFVLGGAILLHDAALCFEAFEGGVDGLRSTTEWKDCFAAAKERDDGKPETAILDDADFAALRGLHAKQAEALGKKSWQLPSGDRIFLIDDVDLRQRYGSLIGQIAASHHWPIEKVAKLGDQINAPGTLPIDWRVDPVKIACLLRCADAAHIDSRRAPDFLYALSRKQGISAEHWKAQNWLARADISQADDQKKSLLYTSNCDFEIEDANAWWIAYDAIGLVSAEIRAANRLLSSRENKKISPPFTVDKVIGAGSPEELSMFVRANGWKPCSAHIHVGNLEKLVKDLGGTQLYGEGDQLGVALRELLQNARDAVVARREIDSEYVGKIRVRLIKALDGRLSLEIEDNGVGMSERVITGPLLDFGTSFWISNLVQEEFPGLRSSKFRSVGRFGIGFYSVFMVACGVTVSSRHWEGALSDIKTLSFPKGLSLRPILSSGRPQDFPSTASTVVKIDLIDGIVPPEGIKITRGHMGETDFHITMSDYLSALVCGIDVDVEFRDADSDTYELLHTSIQNIENAQSKGNWLRKIAFTSYGKTQISEEEIGILQNRLRFIDNDNRKLGLAAISSSLKQGSTFLSMRTIGGLPTSVHSRGSDQFVGFIDYLPKSAKRDATDMPAASRDVLESWAREQVEILKVENVEPLEWASVTCSLCDMKLDPYEVFRAVIMLGDKAYIQTLQEIFELSKTRGIAVFKASFGDHIDTHTAQKSYGEYPTLRPLRNSGFLSLERIEGSAKDKFSFIGCLERYAQAQNYAVDIETTPHVVPSYFGPISVVILKAKTSL
jgi:hypothetical protein